MQPVQDLTVDDRVSRTQYQYTLEDPDQHELNTGRTFLDGPNSCRNWRTWPPISNWAASPVPRLRSRHRFTLRHHPLDHRQHVLRRLRAAADKHDVYPGESISRRSSRRTGSFSNPERSKSVYIQSNALLRRDRYRALVFLCVLRLGLGRLQRAHDVRALQSECESCFFRRAMRFRGSPGAAGKRGVAVRDQFCGEQHCAHERLLAFPKYERAARPSPTRASSRQSPCPSISPQDPPSAPPSPRSTMSRRVCACRRAFRQGFRARRPSFTNSLSNMTTTDSCSARHRLHRFGRPLRELHPPSHDPLDAAVRRRRRLAGAHPLSSGPQRRRHHRHHSSHRHRQEERDHDGRLRSRGASESDGKNATDAIYDACLLRFRPILMTTMAALLAGLPLALGHRLRVRAAPAARYRDGRRLAAQPGPHALHHTGHLHIFRSTRAGLRAAPPHSRRGPNRHPEHELSGPSSGGP